MLQFLNVARNKPSGFINSQTQSVTFNEFQLLFLLPFLKICPKLIFLKLLMALTLSVKI